MPKFITRIQLRNANKEDYLKLNAELEKASFTEDHLDKSNATDIREYNRDGNINIQDVTNAVLKAVSKTGKEYSFTVMRNKKIYS